MGRKGDSQRKINLRLNVAEEGGWKGEREIKKGRRARRGRLPTLPYGRLLLVVYIFFHFMIRI